MKSHLIGLVILLIILPDLVSAEIVTLQNCVIDTGAYILPVDLLGSGKYRNIIPPTPHSGGFVQEGLQWRNDMKQVWGTIVILLEQQHPAAWNNTDLANFLSSEMRQETGKNAALEFVTKPYIGWVASSRVNNTTTILTGYCGAVTRTTPTIFILFITDQSPDMAAYILSNLKIIPKAQEDAALTQSVASSLK
jgi:hypothetical protein